jgi:hypothetical protein
MPERGNEVPNLHERTPPVPARGEFFPLLNFNQTSKCPFLAKKEIFKMSDTEAQKTPDSRELARLLFVAAARFAGSALEDYQREHPKEYESLAAGQPVFTVRIDGMLSAAPRVSIVTLLQRVEVEGQLCARECEVAHVQLARLGGHGSTAH